MIGRRIGFDMDGVLIDHARTIRALLKRQGVELAGQPVSFAVLGEKLDQNQLWHLLDSMYEDAAGTINSCLMPGVEECLANLKVADYHCYLLSRRNDSELPRLMLERLGLWPTYFNQRNAYFVERSSQKPELAKKLRLTDYVDDQPAVLQGPMLFVPNKYLFDQFDCLPANADYERITSWPELEWKLLS